jgi:glucose uptake protein GlcU
METDTSSAVIAVAVKPALTKEIVIGFVAGVVIVGGAVTLTKWKKARDAKKAAEQKNATQD